MKALFTPVLLAALAVGACSYKPLYQKQGDNLRQISIGTIRLNDVVLDVGERRSAQILREELALVLPQEGGEYRLDVTIDEESASLAQRRDATDVRRRLSLIAYVELYDVNGDKLWRRELAASSSYNVEDSPFGADAGRDYARETAARNLSQEIVHEVARWLKFDANAVETE